MPKVLSPVRAVLVYVTSEKEGSYGPFKSALFVEEGTPQKDAPDDKKFWISYNPDSYGDIPKKGSTHTLIPNGKSWAILDQGGGSESGSEGQSQPSNGSNGSTSGAKAINLSDPIAHERRKEEARALVVLGLKFYRYCFDKAKAEFQAELDAGILAPEDIKTIATNIFIEAKKEFPLAELFAVDINLQAAAMMHKRAQRSALQAEEIA